MSELLFCSMVEMPNEMVSYIITEKHTMEESEEKRGASEVKRPSLLWAISEAPRALFELTTYLPFRLLNTGSSEGDGHPVLILPGFMATDMSTVPLRSFVHKMGYSVYGWGEGRNFGHKEYEDLLLEKVAQLYKKHGERVSLIGWSLGGVYARQLAKQLPHMVRQIITLGSPFKGVLVANNATWMYELLKRNKVAESVDPEFLADIPNPAPVPTTAIYSKQDGVVPWEMCMEEENAIHQNIEVRGSHLGLGVNPSVLYIIEDRLKYSRVNWTPFVPDSQLKDIFLYPSLDVA